MTDPELHRLVNEYIRQHRRGRQGAQARFRRMPSLEQALEQAALARRADGKCEPHQCRVGRRRLGAFHAVLTGVLGGLRACTDFDNLHDLIASCRVPGVGPLAVYDTAERIGWHLGIAPARVYLHAGTRSGARALGLGGRHAVELLELPGPLHRLTASELEDFLCIYAGQFGRATPDRRAPGCAPRAVRRGRCDQPVPRRGCVC